MKEAATEVLITCIASNPQTPSVPRDLCMGGKDFEVKFTQLWNSVRLRRKCTADLLKQRFCSFFSRPRVWIRRGQWLQSHGKPGLSPAVPSNVI